MIPHFFTAFLVLSGSSMICAIFSICSGRLSLDRCIAAVYSETFQLIMERKNNRGNIFMHAQVLGKEVGCMVVQQVVIPVCGHKLDHNNRNVFPMLQILFTLPQVIIQRLQNITVRGFNDFKPDGNPEIFPLLSELCGMFRMSADMHCRDVA